jgi:hypothetical protein
MALGIWGWIHGNVYFASLYRFVRALAIAVRFPNV